MLSIFLTMFCCVLLFCFLQFLGFLITAWCLQDSFDGCDFSNVPFDKPSKMSCRKYMPVYPFRGSGKVATKRKQTYKRKSYKKQRGRGEIANKAIEILSPLPLAFTESASRYLVKKALAKLTPKKKNKNCL